MTRASGATRRLSLGVIVPNLRTLGGAERLALACLGRWQERHDVTLYSRGFDEESLASQGIGPAVARRALSSRIQPRSGATGFEQRILDGVLLPRMWSQELGEHDVYLGHQWPTHLIDRHPLVWYAHEPFRFAYDLRYQQPSPHLAQELDDLLTPSPAFAADLRHRTAYEILRQEDARARPDRVVANSRLSASELSRMLGRDDVDVVYPGVDPSGFLAPRWEGDFVLSVGSLHAHKRHRLALEAISLLEDARLVLVGRGPERLWLERTIAALRIGDRVEVRTDVDEAERQRLYATCRAVLFTGVREPFGMVALEALAAGKPLVAVDEGGFTECVDASCAALVPPEPQALAGALAALLANPADAVRMGEAGRKLVTAFSWERTAQELEAILVEAHRDASAAAAVSHGAVAPCRAPRLGVRLIGEFGEGLGEVLWRSALRIRPDLDMPRAGYYASHHETTLRRQLDEIEHCGFDLVTVRLRLTDVGLEPRAVGTLSHLLDLLEEREADTRVAVELCLDRPLSRLVAAALDWLASRLPLRKKVFTSEGRPLVIVTSSNGSPLDRLPEHEALWILSGTGGGPGGLHPVDAGDDESLARGLAEARRGSPRIVWVSSWNDYGSGDHLEPSVRHGDRRAERARALIQELRDVGPEPGEAGAASADGSS